MGCHKKKNEASVFDENNVGGLLKFSADEQNQVIKRFIANCSAPCYLKQVARDFLRFDSSYNGNYRPWVAKIRCVVVAAIQDVSDKGYFQEVSLIDPLAKICRDYKIFRGFINRPYAHKVSKIVRFLNKSTQLHVDDPLFYREQCLSIKKNVNVFTGEQCRLDFDRLGTVFFDGHELVLPECSSVQNMCDFLKSNLFFAVDSVVQDALCRLFVLHVHQAGLSHALSAFLVFHSACKLKTEVELHDHFCQTTCSDNTLRSLAFVPLAYGFQVTETVAYYENGDFSNCLLRLSAQHELTLDPKNLDAGEFFHLVCRKLECRVTPCQRSEDSELQQKNQQLHEYFLDVQKIMHDKARRLTRPANDSAQQQLSKGQASFFCGSLRNSLLYSRISYWSRNIEPEALSVNAREATSEQGVVGCRAVAKL